VTTNNVEIPILIVGVLLNPKFEELEIKMGHQENTRVHNVTQHVLIHTSHHHLEVFELYLMFSKRPLILITKG
jgi:hypothetical protein